MNAATKQSDIAQVPTANARSPQDVPCDRRLRTWWASRVPTAHAAQNRAMNTAGSDGSAACAASGRATLCDADARASSPRSAIRPSNGPARPATRRRSRPSRPGEDPSPPPSAAPGSLTASPSRSVSPSVSVRGRSTSTAAADTAKLAALTPNATPKPPREMTGAAEAKPSTVATDRAVTSTPFARARSSCPTMTGTALRRATLKNVFPAPSTTTAPSSTHSGMRDAQRASTTMARVWARSVATMRVRRVSLAVTAPAARPAVTPDSSRTAITAPTPRALPVTSYENRLSAIRFR